MLKGNIRQILITILIVLVIFLGMHYSLQSFTVNGTSMEPSFVDGEWLLVDKLTYRFNSPDRGDVIIFKLPELEQPYIKRVIGLPGEHVEIRDGRIFISNDDGDFEYVETTDLPDTPTSDNGSWDIPENNYFVLGDNRPASGDSAKGNWTVPRDSIIGKVWIRYWPPSEWGLSPNYSASLE